MGCVVAAGRQGGAWLLRVVQQDVAIYDDAIDQEGIRESGSLV